MATLRKKILYSKIHNILTQNSFVLFFQFNNIKLKEWISLKNQILGLENTNMLVIKNKVYYKMVSNASTFKCNYDKKYTNSVHNAEDKYTQNLAYLVKNKQELLFLCQGPSLIIGFKSIEQLEIISKILIMFKYNLSDTLKSTTTQENFIHSRKNFSYNNINLTTQNTKLVSLLTSNKKKNNEKYNFFFVGGLAQGLIINHLDLIKLSTLNDFAYNDLIKQCYNPILHFLVLKVFVQIKLLKSFENNLIHVLNLYKKNVL